MTTVALAQIYALIFLVIGLGMLINRDYYSKVVKKFGKEPELVTFSGIIISILGLFLITMHNSWTSGWEILVSILNWLIFIRGVVAVIMPEPVIAFAKKAKPKPETITLMGLMFSLLGLLLAYFSYIY